MVVFDAAQKVVARFSLVVGKTQQRKLLVAFGSPKKEHDEKRCSGNGLGCYPPAAALLHSRRARLSSIRSNGNTREGTVAGGLGRNKEEVGRL